ncbi:hypothetical protein ACQX94_003005 [Klebsiella aerogenes]
MKKKKQVNKHGLTRTIPAEIKRTIRQRCGFGCVICGFGFYEYEHFNPDFVDAKEHDANGMTLLCSQCNQKRAKKRLSAHTVALANATPKCKKQGFANEMFDFHHEPIEIQFAGVTFYDCKHLIVVNGRPMLSVQPPQDANSPVLLSGVFCDSTGQETLIIDENEWSVSSDYWDIECKGHRIIVRRGSRDIVLVLRMDCPTGITIERLDMFFEGVRFKGNEKELLVCMNGVTWDHWGTVDVRHSPVGVALFHGLGDDIDPFELLLNMK